MSNTNYFAMIDDDNDFEMWQGLRGPAGADGKSAYQAAVEAGFSGTEAEFNEYLSNIGDLTDEVADQKSAIEALEDLTDRKAGMLIDTASGAIASFVPDSTVPNLLGVSVAVEPVQDLHGYDSPWPGGGGKNLLPMDLATIKANNTAGTWSGNNYTYLGITFAVHVDSDGNVIGVKLSGTSTADWAQLFLVKNHTIQPGNYIVNGVTGGSSTTWRLDVPSVSATNGDIADNLSSAATGDCKIVVRVSGTVCNNVNIYPMIRLSTVSDSTFAPYSNECPISGWSEVGIEADGINVWDEVWEVGAISTSTGQNTSSTTRIRSKNYIPVDPEKTFWFVSAGYNAEALFYDKYKNFISKRSPDMPTTGGLLNQPSNCYFVRFTMYSVYGTTYNHDISINYPSTDHAYHPFAGNTYAITLGQTVYGGTLDVTNGTLTVDRKFEPLNNLTSYNGDAVSWVFDSGNNAFSTNKTVAPAGTAGAESGILSSCYATRAYGYNGSYANETSVIWAHTSGSLRVRDTRFTDVNSWLADVGNQTVCYPLNTPITITLDPVQIAAITGQTNNVWADAGVVTVEFAADLKWYIDKLNQPIEEDMVANNLIASGKYFTVNNRLFLSTASIAAGAQIIPGTNCTETSLAAALNALNA